MDDKELTREEVKLSPYDRLQAILSEADAGKVTKNSLEKIDYILDEVKQPSKLSLVIDKIKSFFNKIDNFIFKSNSRMWNTTFNRRKKDKNRWT